eukprot:scaffold1738_cov198-Skeletonema_marinoi.AAC.10
MAAKQDSDSSSSSSSSSSSDDESTKAEEVSRPEETEVTSSADVDQNDVAEAHQEDTAAAAADDDDDDNDNVNNEGDVGDNDECKAFLSRIPQAFNEEIITRIMEKNFGVGCVAEVSILQEKTDENNDKGDKDAITTDGGADKKSTAEGTTSHRGFGFITFSSVESRDAAVEAGTVRGSVKESSKRKHTLYIRSIVRDDENQQAKDGADKNVCFLWKKFRCPYLDNCKFSHTGEGGCIEKKDDATASSSKKKQKCFAFKKSGTCKLGDDCPFSHDISKPAESTKESTTKPQAKDKSQTDCINWKNKGKCRKGDKCPYKHDESVREKVLAKKKAAAEGSSKDDRKKDKNRQSLSVRVFGLNYDTTEDDMRKFFEHCGPIMEITFPTFEDSGRSKGYCGVLFTSPKAVEQAVALDGSELQGRWLQIQEGKMFLRKWESVENERKEKRMKDDDNGQAVGEYGQKVKKRRKHGFKDD